MKIANPRAASRAPKPESRSRRPHAIYLAIGFPPAAKSCAYRMRETANLLAGMDWDVTVVTIADSSWEREFGLDYTLSDAVDPRIQIMKLPLVREDLETDIRAFSEQRSLDPQGWIAGLRKRAQAQFPEPVFGGWRDALENGVLRVHREHPADLLVTTCAPYVNLAATWRLWEEAGVPYVVDFRDGWSIDVIDGSEAFAPASVAGKWERKVLDQALAVWCVNDPIAQFYRDRYPHLAERVRVVRNGFDADSIPEVARRPNDGEGLTFGYLGSVNFAPAVLDAVLTGWQFAAESDPVIAKSRFEVRGHIGAGALRGVNPHRELLKAAEPWGVSFGGPVAKSDVAETYARWDALVLILVGGRYVTSGKVYEYAASGLPIVSAHDVDHDAVSILSGYPFWTGAVGLQPKRLAESFVRAARFALDATDEQRQAARRFAHAFTRRHQLEPALQEAIELARGRRRPAAELIAAR